MDGDRKDWRTGDRKDWRTDRLTGGKVGEQNPPFT